MPVRIDCDKEGHEGVWIDFRDDPWRYGDRRRILSMFSDEQTLEIVLEYIVGWNVLDVNGKKVKFVPTKTIGEGDDATEVPNFDLFDDLDDVEIIPWIIGAWFLAKNKRMEVPKAT